MEDLFPNQKIPDNTIAVKGKNHVFFLDKTERRAFGPLGVLAGGAGGLISGAGGLLAGAGKLLPIASQVAGPLMQMMTGRAEGEETQDLSKYRQALLQRDREMVRARSEEQVALLSEKRTRFIETQKSQAATGNVKINVGSPLVIESQTNALIAKDMSFILGEARYQDKLLGEEIALEKYYAKKAKKSSRFSTLSQGLSLGSSVFSMGKDAGGFGNLFGNKTTPTAAATFLRY